MRRSVGADCDVVLLLAVIVAGSWVTAFALRLGPTEIEGVGSWAVWTPLMGLGVVAALSVVGGVIRIRRSVSAMAEHVRNSRDALEKGERLRILGLVSGGLAHQLRNAVAGAKLAVQLHARRCANANDDSLDLARRQLARIEADVARFLDLGRDNRAESRPCHMVELVEESVHVLRPQFRHAGVHLRWDPPDADPIVDGDSGRLGHVVVNLLANASEAAGNGGWAEVRVRQPTTEVCVVEVRDNGPGPADEIAGRLFEPFATGKAEGVGLGLFVARQAVEAHGGRLDWRREDDVTCFRVELPTRAEWPVALTAGGLDNHHEPG